MVGFPVVRFQTGRDHLDLASKAGSRQSAVYKAAGRDHRAVSLHHLQLGRSAPRKLSARVENMKIMRDQDGHDIGALLDVSGAAIQAEAVYQPQTACPSRAVDRGRVQVKLHLHRLCQMAKNLAIVDAAAGRTIMNQGHKGVTDHGDGLPTMPEELAHATSNPCNVTSTSRKSACLPLFDHAAGAAHLRALSVARTDLI